MSDKMLKSVKVNKKTDSKPKCKTSAKGKAVTVGSKSTIKKFFRPSDSNVCVEEKPENPTDSRAVYVKALKDRLKNFNVENENIGNEYSTVNNENKLADVTNDLNNPATGSATIDRGRNNRNGAGASIMNDEDSDEDLVLNGENAGKSCDAKYDLLRTKYKELKKEHFQLCHTHCQLSMKYEQLVKTLDAVRKAKSSNAEISDMQPAEISDMQPAEISDMQPTDMPQPSDDVFTPNQVLLLNSLPLEKKKDSNFILKCIEYAYTDNTSVLVNKTLFGTLERKEFGVDGAVVVRSAKDPLTPEKVKRIEELFVKRVTKSKCLASEFTHRIVPTNIHRLIASAIRNVVSKETPKDLQQNNKLVL